MERGRRVPRGARPELLCPRQTKASAENFPASRASASVKATAAGDVRSSGNSDVVGNFTPAIFPRKIEFPDGDKLARPIGRNEAGRLFWNSQLND